MSKLGRIRKAITAGLGMAAALIVLVPEEVIPERWQPPVAFVLWLATVLGVYRVRNDQPVASRQDLAERVAKPSERPPRRRPPTNYP